MAEERPMQRNVESPPSFSYKPDSDFQRVLSFSMDGSAWTLFVMLKLGHSPGIQRLSDILTDIFKNPQEKRDYHADFICLKCRRHFESKSKSKDDGFKVGPDLLQRYSQDDAIIVFSYPKRVAAVEASELWDRRAVAELKFNHWKEPYLDFKNVEDIPLVFEHKKTVCSRGVSS